MDMDAKKLEKLDRCMQIVKWSKELLEKFRLVDDFPTGFDQDKCRQLVTGAGDATMELVLQIQKWAQNDWEGDGVPELLIKLTEDRISANRMQLLELIRSCRS